MLTAANQFFLFFSTSSYVRLSKDLKAKGVDQVLCVSVNDAFVMRHWGEFLKATDHVAFAGASEIPPDGLKVFKLTFLVSGDGNGDLARALGLVKDLTSAGMGLRCFRFAAIVQPDLTVKYVTVDDKEYGSTSADSIIAHL
jgi:glutaredoxin/glutathione-dependent peroxiredoxin